MSEGKVQAEIMRLVTILVDERDAADARANTFFDRGQLWKDKYDALIHQTEQDNECDS